MSEDSALINDARLSFRARGLYLYLQTLPADADRSPAGLSRETKEGRDAVRAALVELIDHGYVLDPRSAPGNRCPVCGGVIGRPKGVTYVAQCQGWVKIGRTSGPVHRRIKALNDRAQQVVCPDGMDPRQPLVLLHVTGSDVEHALHERYAAHHVAGEWFEAEPVLAALGVTV